MALFEKKEQTIIEKLVKTITKSSLTTSNKEYLLTYLNNYQKNNCINQFDTEEELVTFIMKIMENEKLCAKSLEEVFHDASVIYKCFSFFNQSFFASFIRIFERNGIYENNLFSLEVLSVFDNPENYFQMMEIILKNPTFREKFSHLKNLIIELAIYTPNDIELKTMLVYFLKKCSFSGDLEETFADYISLAKKRVGIYEDLDDAYLARVESLVTQLRDFSRIVEKEEKKLRELRESVGDNRRSVEKLKASLEETLEHFNNHLKGIAQKESQKIEEAAERQRQHLQQDYRDIYNLLIRNSDMQAKKLAQNAVASVEQRIQELVNFNKENADILNLNYSSLKTLKEEATKEVREGLEEIKRLLGGLRNVEDLEKLSSLLETIPSVSKMPASLSTPVLQLESNGIVLNAESVKEIPEVNYYFDYEKSFKERFKKAIEKKQEMEANGMLFHEKTDEVIYNLIMGRFPYLCGPSGTGKSYFVKQLGELFALDVTDIGYITEEHDLKGSPTANGSYSVTNWYNCWKYGGIAFADEMDNGVPEATVILNSFLSLENKDYYSFPVVGRTERHPNFRFIAAGNTIGTGATTTYNARNKIDEAVMQRLEFIPFGFDSELDKKLLINYPVWNKFIFLYRNSVRDCSRKNDLLVSGQITTRDIGKIIQDIECGIRSGEDILKAHFIGNKGKDYLIQISKNMQINSQDETTKRLVKRFVELSESHE